MSLTWLSYPSFLLPPTSLLQLHIEGDSEAPAETDKKEEDFFATADQFPVPLPQEESVQPRPVAAAARNGGVTVAEEDGAVPDVSSVVGEAVVSQSARFALAQESHPGKTSFILDIFLVGGLTPFLSFEEG